jgi:hypothetical protein
MHFTFVNKAGEVVKSWDAGYCKIESGSKVLTLREAGVNGDTLTQSTEGNTGLGYFVDASAFGCNPASKKEREYAPMVLKRFAKVPADAVVSYGMPSLDSNGQLTGEVTYIIRTTMQAIRDTAQAVLDWNPTGEVIAPMPTIPAGLVPAKKRGKTRASAEVLEWDEESEG